MSIDAKPWPGGGAASVPDASETVKGIIEIADSVESAAGTDDLKAMTPRKVKERIDAALVGGVEYKGSYTGQSLVTAQQGDMYISAATYSLAGVQFLSGDHLIFNQNASDPVTSAMFDKIDNTDAVSSVNTLTGAVVLSADDLAADHSPSNYIPANANIDGHLSGIDDELFLKAPKASPILTGTPTAPTATQGDNSTRIATTAYVDLAVSGAGNQINDIETKTSSTFTAQSNYVYVCGYPVGTQTVTMPDASGSTPGDIIGFTTRNQSYTIDLVSSDGTTNDLLNISNQTKGGTLGALSITINRQISWFVCSGTQWQEANASFFTQPISTDMVPTSANTYDLGSPSGEWADLYLGDGGIIYWGNDQDVKLIHDPDDGLTLDLGVTDSSHDPQFELKSESSASFGPRLLFNMQSTTPAANDRLGQLTFKGLDSGSGSTEYAYVFGQIEDPTAGAEAGRVDILPLPCSTQTKGLHVIGIPSELNGAKVDIDHNGTDYGLHLNGTIVAASAAELSLLDGGSSVGASVTIADTDGFILNDGGVTKLIPASDLKTYAGGGISAVVEDTTPQLGGPLDVNGQAITSASNGDIAINPDGTGDISIGADMIPDADATHTIGDEDNRFISIYSDVNGALRFKAKNDEGAQITKGQVVYIKGLAGDGETPTVGLADADDASKMPAFGLAFNTANDQAEIQIVSVGNLYGLNTSAFSVGDTLYVDTTAGGLVNTKPTGETAQLQNIGRVIRSNNGAGVIMVGGAGRSAATPNLDDGKIFLGNASNQAVSTALSAINLTSFNDDLGLATVATTGAYSDLSGTPTLGTAAALDVGTSASNVVQLDGSARLPAVDGSQLTNLPSGATQLNDLSDVTITGASTGEVLRYSGAAWVDATLAYSDLSGTPTLATVATTGAYSDLSGTPTLGTAAALDVGTSASNVVQLDGSARLPAVDGSQLTNLPTASAASETVAGIIEIATNAEAGAGTATDKALVPSNVSSLSIGSGQVSGLATVATTGAYSDLSGTPTLATVATTGAYSDLSGTPTLGTAAALDVGTSASNVVQLDGSARLPAVDGSQLTNLPSGGGGWTYSAITADPANAQANYHYSCTGTFTITLPTTGMSAGQEIRIKNMGTGTITVDPQTSNIDGSTTDYVMDVQYGAITLVSTGTHWEII